MTVESDQKRACTALRCFIQYLLDEEAMAAVHAVEEAYGTD